MLFRRPISVLPSRNTTTSSSNITRGTVHNIVHNKKARLAMLLNFISLCQILDDFTHQEENASIHAIHYVDIKTFNMK